MNKLFLFLIGLICFLSVVSALQEQPYTVEEFNQRLITALEHNKSKLIVAAYDEYGNISDEAMQAAIEKNNKLEELKNQAVNEYKIFLNAYNLNDAEKARSQHDKLKKIFDEMDSLMLTRIKFGGIYENIFYWTTKLEYLVKNGLVESDTNSIDANKTIDAVRNKTADEINLTDCCAKDPASECCKEKIKADCCVTEPDSQCCKEKQPQPDLLIPIVVGLIIIVGAIVYAVFMRKRY